jgi:thioesterase domain-containing protein/aryl carrier-like protein
MTDPTFRSGGLPRLAIANGIDARGWNRSAPIFGDLRHLQCPLERLPTPIVDSVLSLSTREDETVMATDPARDDLERRLQRLWQTTLGGPAIGPDDNFFDVGGDSLMAVHLLAEVDRQFGCTLRLATMFQAPTIRQQAALLRLENPQLTASSVVPIQTGGPRSPLFFVSGLGGAIVPFHAMAKEMNPEQPLYVLDLNAFADTGSTGLTLEAVAAGMIRDLRKVQADGPYHLAGYSLGGMIVYEIAQQLQRAGQAVALLALLDSPAPGYPRIRSFPVRVLLHIKHALGLGPRETCAYLLERIRRLKKYVMRTEPRLFEAGDPMPATRLTRAMEAAARAIRRASRAYVPLFYPGRIVLIRAEIRDVRPGAVDDDLLQGWGSLVGGGVDVKDLNCCHLEMLDAEYSVALAKLLSDSLAAGAVPVRRRQRERAPSS